MSLNLNVDSKEVEKFENLAKSWWDPRGPCKPLHDLNPARLQFISDRFVLADQRILDIGCGGGILTEALSQQGAKVTGLDAGMAVIECARQHAKSQNLQIQYEVSTAEDWAIAHPHTYDLITCMELLEHVPDPVQLLQAAVTLLKPRGHLFLSTLNRTPPAFMKAIVGAEYLMKLLPQGTHRYRAFIRPSELAKWLRDLGCSVHDLKGLDYNPFLHRAKITSDVQVNYLVHASLSSSPLNFRG